MNDLDVQLTPTTWSLMEEPNAIQSHKDDVRNNAAIRIDPPVTSCESNGSTGKVDSVATQKVSHSKVREASKAKEQRPVSRVMNDRYPIIETGRKTSDSSLKALKRKVSQKGLGALRRISYTRKTSKESSTSEKERKISDSLIEHGRHPDLGTKNDERPADVSGGSKGIARSKTHRPSTPIQEMVLSDNIDVEHNGDHVPAVAQSRQHAVSVQQRPKSAFDLRARYKSSRNDLRNGSINIRRKTAEPAALLAPSLEDPTLRKISAGPYAVDNSTLLNLPDVKATSVSKENARTTLSTIGVAIGSPGWRKTEQCTTGTPPSADKERTRYGSTNRASIRAVQSSRELGRGGASSPVVYHSINRRAVGQGSPGQRMVDDFMKRRREEESPVSNSTGAAFL